MSLISYKTPKETSNGRLVMVRRMANVNTNQNKNLSISARGGDYVFYYKKTEKILGALYLVTSYFDREEPIKWRIRQKANDLHTAVAGLKDVSDAALGERKRIVRETVGEITSLLWVARASGLISAMNADVCSSELESLADGVQASAGFEGGSGMPLQELFNTERETNAAHAYDGRDHSHEQGARSVGGAQQKSEQSGTSTATAGESASAEESPSPGARSPKPAVQAKKSKRQKAILRLIREQGEISVKDAAKAVTNCSEKTLQRELQALVTEGVLKKEGKRRWTRYSFA